MRQWPMSILKQFLFLSLILTVFASASARELDAGELTYPRTLFVSLKDGEAVSPDNAVGVGLDGGGIAEGGSYQFWKLGKVDDSLEFKFSLPKDVKTVEAVIQCVFNAEVTGKARIRWNSQSLTDETGKTRVFEFTGGRDFTETLKLDEFQRENSLKILATEGTVGIRSVTFRCAIPYPSRNFGGLVITQTEPIPDRILDGKPATVKWTAQGREENNGRENIGENNRRAGTRMVLTIKGVEYPFSWCPAGTFMMGSPPTEAERIDGETQHQVTLTKGFWMLESEVTQEMWESVTGNNPSHFKGNSKLPVEMVSWEDCQESIRKFNALNMAPAGYRFSLPTEAQWEYACRAGTTTPFHFGSVLNGDKANCRGNYPYGTSTNGPYVEKTTVTGSYPANAWGLYDMHGNVWEWCWDWYGEYPNGNVTDPVGPPTGSGRVLRGGSWCDDARYCRSAYRGSNGPSGRGDAAGLRLSLVREE